MRKNTCNLSEGNTKASARLRHFLNTQADVMRAAMRVIPLGPVSGWFVIVHPLYYTANQA